MKVVKLFIVILIVIGVLAAIKVFYLTPNDSGSSLMVGGKAAGGPIAPVTVFVAKSAILNNTVYATGTILPNEEVTLMPEISGKIISLYIAEGAVVNKGALLVKINDADFQAQLKKLQLQKKLIEEKNTRLSQLLTIHGISQEEYDIAVNNLNTINADIEFTMAQIAKTEIRAPFNGVLGLRNVSEGSFVNPSVAISTIQQVNPVKIDFSVPEKYAGVLHKDDIITFSVDGSNEKRKARIYAIQPNIDEITRTIPLRALAENSRADLFPGAFTKVELPLRKIDNAIMIPTEAIIPILKGKKVFICKEGKAMEVIVETGIRTDAQVQITNGIADGDSVITTGIMQLKAGMLVKVSNSKN